MKTRRACALLLFLSGLLLSACDEEEPKPDNGEDSGVGGGEKPAGSTADAGSPGSDARAPSRDASPPKELPAADNPCAALPPNTFGTKSGKKCDLVCAKGFADCDGKLDDGCEVDLRAPNACDRCDMAACLHHELCGLDAPTCPEHFGTRWTTMGRPDDGFGVVAAGPKPQQVFATMVPGFADTVPNTGLSVPSGSLFEVQLGEGGKGALWSAGKSGPASSMWRFGERLFLVGTKRNDSNTGSGALLIVADLTGKLVWQKELFVPGASLCGSHVTADDAGSVYFGAALCDGKLELNGKSYDPDTWGSALLIVAYDASGNERWRAVPHDGESDNDNCFLGGSSIIRSLAVANGKLIELNRECLIEVDAATGKHIADHRLYAEVEPGKLAVDGAGNVYVAGESHDRNALLEADVASSAADADQKDWAQRVHVSKYDSAFKLLWSKPILVSSTAGFVDFAVSPAGKGMLVGERKLSEFDVTYWVADFDSDGKVFGAGNLQKQWAPTSVSMGADDTPYLGGTLEGDAKLGYGMFVWEFPLKK